MGAIPAAGYHGLVAAAAADTKRSVETGPRRREGSSTRRRGEVENIRRDDGGNSDDAPRARVIITPNCSGGDEHLGVAVAVVEQACLLYTSPSPRD